MSDVGYDIVKWQKRWFWSIRVKIGLHKCQSEVGTQSDFFWWSGYPVRFFLVKWVPSVRFFWWSGYPVSDFFGEVGTRYQSDKVKWVQGTHLTLVKWVQGWCQIRSLINSMIKIIDEWCYKRDKDFLIYHGFEN